MSEQGEPLVPRTILPADISVDDVRVARSGGALSVLHGATMGTYFTLQHTAANGNRVAERAPAEALERAFADVIAQMSHFDPTSELCRLNRSPRGTEVVISPRFFKVLSFALDLSEHTGGMYHPALGAVSSRHGFGPEPFRHVESAPPLEIWKHIRLNPATCGVTHDLERLDLDLSSIAKGFALDYAAAALEESGYGNFLLEIGGEFVARGCKPDLMPWWVEVPGSSALPALRFALTRHALATSGVPPGAHAHHVMDPSTGFPLQDPMRTVTVLGSDCMTADAQATALLALSPERAMSFANERGIPVAFGTGSEWRFSRSLERLLDGPGE